MKDSRQPQDTEIREIAERLNSVMVRLLRRIRLADRVMGLSAPRASLLSVLVFGGPRPIGELAEIEQVSPPAITQMVSSLEEHGLARRERSTQDRRVVVVHATEEGTRLLERGRVARVEMLAALLEALEHDEMMSVEGAVEALSKVIRDPGGT